MKRKNNPQQLPIFLLIIISLSVTAFSSSNNFHTSSRFRSIAPFCPNHSETQLNARNDASNHLEYNNKNHKKRFKKNSNSELRVSSATNIPMRGGGTGVKLNKIRDAVFPIYGKNEITKFLLLGTMKFFIIFVLTLTRDTKDTLIVTQCGAEAIAFLKVRPFFLTFFIAHILVCNHIVFPPII